MEQQQPYYDLCLSSSPSSYTNNAIESPHIYRSPGLFLRSLFGFNLFNLIAFHVIVLPCLRIGRASVSPEFIQKRHFVLVFKAGERPLPIGTPWIDTAPGTCVHSTQVINSGLLFGYRVSCVAHRQCASNVLSTLISAELWRFGESNCQGLIVNSRRPSFHSCLRPWMATGSLWDECHWTPCWSGSRFNFKEEPGREEEMLP